MKKVLAGLMFLILSLTGCTQAQPTTYTPTQVATSQPTQAQCEEDMPCWDCHTMGNKLCGPQAPVKATPEPPKANEVVVTQADLQAIETTLDTAPALSIAAQLELESIVFAGTPYIPMDEYTTVTYTGTSPYDLTDGDVLWSVQSNVSPTVWHTYHVILTPAPETIVYLPTTAPQATQAVAPAPAPAPQPTTAPAVAPQPTQEAPEPLPTVTPAPQPTEPEPTQAPTQPTVTNDPGACMGWHSKMEAWNAAHPDDQLTAADMGRICTGQ